MMGSASLSKREEQKREGKLERLVESDKAERLYKAAISSPVTENDELMPEEKEAAVSLVRHMQVSIREAAKVGGDIVRVGSGATATQRKPSASPQEAHGKMGQDTTPGTGTEEARKSPPLHHALNRLPSLHSLRTLRLSTPSFNRGAISPSMSDSEKGSTLGRHFGADDEDWSQRGRTRSARGLAWVDSGLTSDNRPPQGKVKLDEIFNSGSQAGSATTQANETIDEVSRRNKVTHRSTIALPIYPFLLCALRSQMHSV